MAVREAVAMACRVRLRPVLMTSLATIIGLLPMALKLGAGSEAYAPLARAILGGLTVSVVLTVFLVPAAYLLVYRRPRPSGRSSLICAFLLIVILGSRAPGAAAVPPLRWRRPSSSPLQNNPRFPPPGSTPPRRTRSRRSIKAAY